MSCEPNHRRASASSVCSRSRVMPTRKGPRAARRRGPQRCRRSPGTHALHLSAIAQSLALHLVDDRDLPLLAPAILPNLPGCPLAAFRVADDSVQFRPGNPFKVRQFIPHDSKLPVWAFESRSNRRLQPAEPDNRLFPRLSPNRICRGRAKLDANDP